MKINPLALKEWDSTIKVLAEGRQVILLRKGPELVKEKERHYVERYLDGCEPDAPSVRLTV